MTEILLNPTDSASISSGGFFEAVDGDANRKGIFFCQPRQLEQKVVFETRIIVDQGGALLIAQPIYLHSPTMTQAEKEFSEQKAAFGGIPPLLLVPFTGEYVVSHNGEILDHGPDLPTLTARFFEAHGDMPVYITKIGEEVDDRFDTPFFA